MSPTKLYGYAIQRIPDIGTTPDAWWQEFNGHAHWVPGMRQHCLFDYDDCVLWIARLTTPGGNWWVGSGYHVCGVFTALPLSLRVIESEEQS